MAKFLQIRAKHTSEEDAKVLKKVLSAESLKELFKCKEVFRLSQIDPKKKSIFKIPTKDLEVFANIFCYMNTETLGFDDFYSTYEFIFSDDAEITSLSFYSLKYDLKFSAFEINKNEISKLTILLEELEPKDEIIDKLETAHELWESLREIEINLDIDLISYGSYELITENLSKVRETAKLLSSEVNSYLTENPWK